MNENLEASEIAKSKLEKEKEDTVASMEEQRKTEVRALKSKNVELQTRLTTYEEQDDNLKKFGKEKAALED